MTILLQPGPLSGANAQISAAVALAAAGTEKAILRGPLPATLAQLNSQSVLNAGTTIGVLCQGTFQAAASGTLTGRWNIGTNSDGITSATHVTSVVNTTVITVLVGWTFAGLFTVVTTGSGGTCMAELVLTINGQTTSNSTTTATSAINTTVANTVSFTITTAGTTLTNANATAGTIYVAHA